MARSHKKPGPPRSVAPEDIVQPREGEEGVQRKPLVVRLAGEAIRGGLIDRLEQVDELPVAVERPLPAAVEVTASPALASVGPAVKVSPTAEIVDLIREIAMGRYKGDVPARDVIQAARLLCDFGVSKPTQGLDVRAATITVLSPFSDTDDDAVDSFREPVPFASLAEFGK
jgi:hypothetical protein